MSKHHEIVIRLVDDWAVTDPSPALRVGDTVRYSSPDGKVRVSFTSGSPYPVSDISDGESHKLQKPGKFPFQCFVTPPGQTREVGWQPGNPEAGGEHDVRT